MVTRHSQDSTLNELSSVIGELRSFAAQQVATNAHIVDELKKISERMATFSEIGATFIEYRKTLHERFAKIHEQIGSIDLTTEKLQERQNAVDLLVATWKSNWKMMVAILYVVSSFTSALIVQYGSAIIKAITTH
jgi:hypothetical protein